MAHIVVQIGPCCTVPIGSLVPGELSNKWKPPVRAHLLHDRRKDCSRGIGRSSVQRNRRLRTAHSRAQAK